MYTVQSPSLWRLKVNSVVLAVSILVFEVIVLTMYGLYMQYPLTGGNYDQFGVMMLFCLLLLLIVGFSLLLTYIRTASWSGIGYTLFILAITIQLYFLINAFLTKAQVQPSFQSLVTSQTAAYMELTPFYSRFGSSFTNAVGCALSVYVSYTAFHGRVGALEIFYHTIITVIGYQVNRQVLLRIGTNDNGGSMGIFLYGSMSGMIVSWIIGVGRMHLTKSSVKFRSDRNNYLYTLLGAVFIWALIPAMSSINTLTQTNRAITNPYVSAGPMNTWFALSASTWASFCMSILLHKRISLHDVAYGSFSGAIAFGSSSNLVFSPVAAIIIGLVAGVIAVSMLSYLRRYMNRHGVLNSNGFVETFMLSGFQGGIWSSIIIIFANQYQYYTNGYSLPITSDVYTQGGLQIAGTFISIGMGIFMGFVSTAILRPINRMQAEDYFDDGYGWSIEDDGLYTDYERRSQAASVENIQSNHVD